MSLKYRPLALSGFTVLAVLFFSIFVDERFSLVSIAGGTLVFLCCVIFKKIRDKVFPFFLSGALILGGCLFTLANDYGLKYAKDFAGDEAIIDGVISDFPTYSDSRYYYLLETNSIDGKALNVKLRLSLTNEIEAEPYDRIKVQAEIYLIGNSAGEDIERYFHSKGIYLGAYTYNGDDSPVYIQKNENKPLKYSILKLRKEIEERILDKLPNEYGGTAIALLLGDKSFISDETKDKLYEAGIAPVFAVSGLHLSIWVMGLYEILEQLKVRKRINSTVSIVFTLFFMALTGFSPSVCRSGLMMILLLSGNIFYRRSDSVNSLGFSALVLCIINPFIAADIGFLLSFTATLGIILICPVLEKTVISRLSFNPLKAVLSAVFVSFAAIIGSLPVTIIFIESLALFALISNLLVTYAAALCMVMSGFTALLYRITFISDMTAFFAGHLAKYILKVVDVINSFSVTSVSTADIFWKSGVVFCLAVVAFSFIAFKKKTAVKVCLIGLCAVILSTSVCSVFYYDGLTRAEILDVGDGICLSVSNGKKKILLCGEADGYNAVYSVEDSLDRISRRDTNLMLIPNTDSADSPTTLQLLKNNDFVKVVMPYCTQSVSQLVDSEKILTVTDLTMNVWDGGTVKFHCDSEASYVYCNFDSVTFFIIFSSEKDSVFPDEFSAADYLVCDGYIPDSLDPSAYGTVVLSTVNKKSDSISEYVRSRGGRALSTCDAGDITVRVRDSESSIYLKNNL